MNTRYVDAVKATKRDLLVEALKTHGSMRKAAAWLGVSAATVCRDCRLLGITLQATKPTVQFRKGA